MATAIDATAVELARAIRSRECSAFELVKGLLEQKRIVYVCTNGMFIRKRLLPGSV